jgi:O-Antigen ligase
VIDFYKLVFYSLHPNQDGSFVLNGLRIKKEKWLREISFGLLSLVLAFIFFYLTTQKRPPLTLSLAVGLVLLGVVTHLVLKQGKWALLILFSFSPFYPFIRIQLLRFQVVGQLVMFAVSRWSEFLMILAMLGRKLGGIRRIFYAAPLLDYLTVSYLILGLVYFVRAAVQGNGIMGMWGVKETFLFYIYYFMVRFIPFGKDDLRKYLVLSALIGTAIAAFGCIQAQFFGLDFLKTLGYGVELKGGGYTFVPPTYVRKLPGGLSFIRAISILQDALSLGAYLMVLLLVLQPFYLFPQEKRHRWWRHAQYLILLLGLLYTTTRSAWVGMAVGTLVLAWTRKKLLATLSAFLVLGIFMLILLLSIPGGWEFLYSSLFTGKESSAVVHMSTYGWQFQLMIDNPLGIGLGMSGRVGRIFGGASIGAFQTECWYLQVGTQMGFPGFFLYIAVVLETMRSLFLLGSRLKDPFLRDLAKGILAAYLACSVFGIFLNVWSCHVIPIFMHLFVGMALFHFPHLDAENERAEVK